MGAGFWPPTAGGWVALTGGALTVLGALGGLLGWVWPWLRRRLGWAETADVRVHVRAVVLHEPDTDRQRSLVRISIENHSSDIVRLDGIALEYGGGGILVQRDSLTGELNAGQVIEAGDCHDFHLDSAIVEQETEKPLRYAMVRDRLRREFRSRKREFKKAWDQLVKMREPHLDR